MNKKREKKELTKALSHQCFWVHNGPILSDLREFKSALADGSITEEQYTHHANKEKNDFALWILHSLGDKKCSKALANVRKMKTALRVVETCLQDYKE